jgi:hypothetical protein
MSSFPFATLGENQELEANGPAVHGSAAALGCPSFFLGLLMFLGEIFVAAANLRIGLQQVPASKSVPAQVRLSHTTNREPPNPSLGANGGHPLDTGNVCGRPASVDTCYTYNIVQRRDREERRIMKPKFGIIGDGNMGAALRRGLEAAGYSCIISRKGF